MVLIFLTLFVATVFLSYANGANDNFKGVATLFGSDTTDYRKALWWATATTFAGSVCSVFLAQALVKSFSGKGLVPEALAGTPEFLVPVAAGTGFTVMLATLTGFPISTTHSLTGALIGAGLVAVGSGVNFSVLTGKFFLPLLISPILAVLFCGGLYRMFNRLRIKMGITHETCVCVGEKQQAFALARAETYAVDTASAGKEIAIDNEANCVSVYTGSLIGMSAQKLLDTLHYLSAGVVSFARGLNDTPKIIALLVVLQALDIRFGMVIVGVAMAVGGLLNARKVAVVMSKRITPLNHGQGFTANLVTGILVIFASRLGMPVSTTHVSVGSLFGLGMVTGRGNKNVIGQILTSWILTLPISALTSGALYFILNNLR